MKDLINQLFLGACRQLFEDFVGIPDHHMWALDVLRSEGK